MATAAVLTMRPADDLLGSARSRRMVTPSTISSTTSKGTAIIKDHQSNPNHKTPIVTVRYSSADAEFESQFPAIAATNDDGARLPTRHLLSSAAAAAAASTARTALVVGDHHSDRQEGGAVIVEAMDCRGGKEGVLDGYSQERATSAAVPMWPPPCSAEEGGETHPPLPSDSSSSRSSSDDLPRLPENGNSFFLIRIALGVAMLFLGFWRETLIRVRSTWTSSLVLFAGFRRGLRLRVQRTWSAFGSSSSSSSSSSRYSPILSGTLYAVMSCTMVLMNKQVLSGYQFNAINSLLLFQNLISVLTVLAGRGLGLFAVEPLTAKLCRVWIPVNALFVAMLLSGFYSLDYLTVPMATILKNLTNVSNAAGDWIFNGAQQSAGVWGAVGLIILSSYCGGVTDLHFNLRGYVWQISNCLLASSYSLYLKRTMDKAKSATVSGELSKISMVMLNNTLSLPFGIALVLLTGETRELASSVAVRNPYFWIAATVTGFVGVILNFAVMWFLHATSPTTVGVVSSLSKIPTSVLGLVLFPARTTVYNLLSIAFGLVAGMLFTKARLNQQRQASSSGKDLPR
ncbi:hypothetical protein CBR_g50780 [Chara braunii]|uniref:Sugar phosphate transporter domain-containing protein n=1 Tax=Chara braunii TaxID=69332 RepID=A0A388K5U1_CHABU|nr:hypothetical protein CBR_g50780 [Chara braunii]|eukprot:GBG65420.1 hypothetical protein CBR_g50780 [Chara braunii]